MGQAEGHCHCTSGSPGEHNSTVPELWGPLLFSCWCKVLAHQLVLLPAANQRPPRPASRACLHTRTPPNWAAVGNCRCRPGNCCMAACHPGILLAPLTTCACCFVFVCRTGCCSLMSPSSSLGEADSLGSSARHAWSLYCAVPCLAVVKPAVRAAHCSRQLMRPLAADSPPVGASRC